MEKFLELRHKAEKYAKTAEQTINFTYPLVKENKIMLTVINQLFLANTTIMGSLLHYELYHKRIPFFDDNFESKFHLLRSRVADKYSIDPEYLKLLRDLKDIIIAHNNSPIEFSRGNKLVICNDNYELKELTIENLKKALSKTKLFIEDIIYITNKNEKALVR